MKKAFIIFCIAVLVPIIFMSCKREVSVPYYDDGSIFISFPNIQKEFFKSVGSSFDEKTGIEFTEYKPIDDHPHFVIAKESNPNVYDQLQKGIRPECPLEFMVGYNENITSLPTHTEVLNDTTFLLGQMWCKFDKNDRLQKELFGPNGWMATIIRPQSVIYINIFHNNRIIQTDSLLFWSLSIREELKVDFPDFSMD